MRPHHVVPLALLLLTRTAAAETLERDASPDTTGTDAFLPLSTAARITPDARIGRLETGYDLAHNAAVLDASAEATIIGPLAIRLGAQSGERGGVRPTAGVRVQALHADRHGIDAALALTYKPEGFTEPDGELEATLAVGRGGVTGNLVYGQDADGRERDAEARAAVVFAATQHVSLGLDARVRVDLSAMPAATSFDAIGGPLVAYAFERIVVTLEPGVSVFRTNATHAGAVALVGAGFAY